MARCGGLGGEPWGESWRSIGVNEPNILAAVMVTSWQRLIHIEQMGGAGNRMAWISVSHWAINRLINAYLPQKNYQMFYIANHRWIALQSWDVHHPQDDLLHGQLQILGRVLSHQPGFFNIDSHIIDKPSGQHS